MEYSWKLQTRHVPDYYYCEDLDVCIHSNALDDWDNPHYHLSNLHDYNNNLDLCHCHDDCCKHINNFEYCNNLGNCSRFLPLWLWRGNDRVCEEALWFCQFNVLKSCHNGLIPGISKVLGLAFIGLCILM